jgi:putative membrane protein
MGFLTEAGQRALEAAVEAIEAESAAEIVIAVRPRARYALTPHATVGITTAIALLAFTLFSDVEFALWHILVLPIFAGVLGALVVEALPPLYRFLAPPWLRQEHVREAAYAAFVERGVHATRDRTGILIYIALRERMVEIVGDVAIVDELGIETLAAWAGTLEANVPHGAEPFAKALRELAPELARTLPRRDDDIDELANAVHVFGAPPRHRRTAP